MLMNGAGLLSVFCFVPVVCFVRERFCVGVDVCLGACGQLMFTDTHLCAYKQLICTIQKHTTVDYSLCLFDRYDESE